MKGAVVVDGLDAAALADYAGVCGLLWPRATPARAARR
jgi:hypothetical protein